MANLTKLEGHLATRSYIEGYVGRPFTASLFSLVSRHRSSIDGQVVHEPICKDETLRYQEYARYGPGDL